jgi:primosomal protein N' (replication factor Y)
MISLVDRNRSKLREGIVCEPTITSIEQTIAHGDNVLVYINRRGAHRAYVCEDCSAVTQCPHCDVSLTLHTSP